MIKGDKTVPVDEMLCNLCNDLLWGDGPEIIFEEEDDLWEQFPPEIERQLHEQSFRETDPEFYCTDD